MYIQRTLYKKALEKIGSGKAIIVLGPRQSGKTTLLREIASNSGKRFRWLDCDTTEIREALSTTNPERLRRLVGDSEMLFIDEAQRVRDIGITLKIFTDQIREVQLVVSGSSAFELSNIINEPLTGRKWEYLLLPLSTEELEAQNGYLEESLQLHNRLLYGMYPDVVSKPGQEQELLANLSVNYLYKDIFTFQDVRKPELLEKLLKGLALQIGSEISFQELARFIESDQATVQRYLDLLEKTFIVFRLLSFSRNLRNELKRSRKIYFYDNGIRNALIGNFNPLANRSDVGALWENFMVSERIKRTRHHKLFRNEYFWRTVEQQEIDYIEEYDGQLFAYEFKWNPTKTVRAPKTFLNAYPEATFNVIHPKNYLDEFLNAPNE
ncbi:MAG: ATP-binding protein [Saprospiraceae bacterium]